MGKHPLLDTIQSPDALEAMDISQLEQVCAELREQMIDTVSRNGGHLASNLGAVELTVALHRNFHYPQDQIIFDVGHQCYAHKMLTGRLASFDTLRQQGGISGFLNPEESDYDAFLTGHSSTSVSAALGIAQAKRIKGEKGWAVAVIGDGALSGGLAYEGLNNAGRSHGGNLIVVLNDNKMSISRNVGAMARHLAVMRARPAYHQFKSTTERIILKIPLIGKYLRNGLVKLKTAAKNAVYNSTIFEDMGFAYLGPVDGHNLELLDSVFQVAKTVRRPALIHVCTVKGKGYDYAEKNPSIFHGVSAFDVETGERLPGGKSYSQQFGETICRLAATDSKICAITAAMCESTGLAPFQNSFRERFFDVGIAEQHAVTFAAGLSSAGMLPVFAVYSSFLQRAYDQILHDAAAQSLKLVLAIDRAGVVGEDGKTHQGVFDVAFLNSIPGVTVYAPVTFGELDYFLHQAFYRAPGVAAVRYPRGAQVPVPAEYSDCHQPWRLLGEHTAKAAIVTYGRTISAALQAATLLQQQGIHVRLLQLCQIRPVDVAAAAAVADCEQVFFFEEGMRIGGVAEHFEVLCREQGFDGRFLITAVEEQFLPHATTAQTLQAIGLDRDSICRKIKEALACQ